MANHGLHCWIPQRVVPFALTVLTVFTGLARRVHNATSGFAMRILFTSTLCDIFPGTLAHTMYIKVPASKQGISHPPLYLSSPPPHTGIIPCCSCVSKCELQRFAARLQLWLISGWLAIKLLWLINIWLRLAPHQAMANASVVRFGFPQPAPPPHPPQPLLHCTPVVRSACAHPNKTNHFLQNVKYCEFYNLFPRHFVVPSECCIRARWCYACVF